MLGTRGSCVTGEYAPIRTDISGEVVSLLPPLPVAPPVPPYSLLACSPTTILVTPDECHFSFLKSKLTGSTLLRLEETSVATALARCGGREYCLHRSIAWPREGCMGREESVGNERELRDPRIEKSTWDEGSGTRVVT